MNTEEMIKALQDSIDALKKEILEKEQVITELKEQLEGSNENN